jgi:predicted lactoylglutathione lyase
MAAIDDGELPAEKVAAKYGVRPEGNPNCGERSYIAVIIQRESGAPASATAGEPCRCHRADDVSPYNEFSGGETMATKIFVNLPIRDLNKSVEFFTKLGFTFNPQFTDETATCMIVSEDIFVMLLTREKFKDFIPHEVCDATKSSEVIICLSCENRAKVDEITGKAIAAGAASPMGSKDYGFMYQNSFQDLDGHLWELVYMESGVEKQN